MFILILNIIGAKNKGKSGKLEESKQSENGCFEAFEENVEIKD